MKKNYECIEIPLSALWSNHSDFKGCRSFYANGFKSAREWCKAPLFWCSNARGWWGFSATHQYMVRECR